jgi:hypothetical protein
MTPLSSAARWLVGRAVAAPAGWLAQQPAEWVAA